MSTDKTITLAEAVGHRFDDIFGQKEDGEVKAPPPKKDAGPPILDSPILDLKSIVLTIEWEITEPLLDRFQLEVNSLEQTFHERPILVRFLKILRSLGKYIKNRKAEAHPDSIKLMTTVFNRFERVIQNEAMPLAEQKSLFNKTHQDFNRLKELISIQAREKKSAAAPPVEEPTRETPPASDAAMTKKKDDGQTVDGALKAGGPVEAPEAPAPAVPKTSDYGGMAPHEAFAQAVEELKGLIKAEFSALRDEIKRWREG